MKMEAAGVRLRKAIILRFSGSPSHAREVLALVLHHNSAAELYG
jgi:hypothetical protein